MPRWEALPDELDPQIKEFTDQLRGIVDRSGLSVASVSDRTGYSRTSWEHYLSGRLLAPKGAIVALAEVTGIDPMHLTILWEHAERAWSRAEMRHDMTMEAIRIAQGSAALNEPSAPPSWGGSRPDGGPAVQPGVAGPPGVVPSVPPQPTAAEVPDAAGGVRDAGRGGPSGGWGVPGAAEPPQPGGNGDKRPPAGPGSGNRTWTLIVGAVGALIVVAAAFYVMGVENDKKRNEAQTSSSPTATSGTSLPPGVECRGASCEGKDPEVMGCGGDLVTTVRTGTVGATTVEVRYSETCAAAWGRVTLGTRGDTVEITTSTSTQSDTVTAPGDTATYTMMLPVESAADATACVTLAATGEKGCAQ